MILTSVDKKQSNVPCGNELHDIDAGANTVQKPSAANFSVRLTAYHKKANLNYVSSLQFITFPTHFYNSKEQRHTKTPFFIQIITIAKEDNLDVAVCENPEYNLTRDNNSY